MKEFLINLVDFLPNWLQVTTIAAMPVIEIRGAIPYATEVLQMNPWTAYWLSIVGNMIPPLFLVAFLEGLAKWLSRHFKFWRKFFRKLYRKTHTKHAKKFDKVGALMLITFVAIPIPGSGAWTGSLIASLFKVPYLKAVFLINLGIAISGLIVLWGFKLLQLIF